MTRLPLYERYRPRRLEDVVGQPQACAKLQRAIDRDAVAGRAWWVSGRSGGGKTTIARILAESVADETSVYEYDGREMTVAELARLRATCYAGRPLFGSGYAIIVNEAHNVKDATRFLGLLEPIPDWVVWLFTTTTDGQLTFDGMADSSPLLSRCRSIPLQSRGVADAFAQLAQQIARAENLDGQPLSAYKVLVNKHRSNMRGVLQSIENEDMLTD